MIRYRKAQRDLGICGSPPCTLLNVEISEFVIFGQLPRLIGPPIKKYLLINTGKSVLLCQSPRLAFEGVVVVTELPSLKLVSRGTRDGVCLTVLRKL